MPDIEISPEPPAADQGIASRLRNLFTRNERTQTAGQTTEDRLKQLQTEGNQIAPLSGSTRERPGPMTGPEIDAAVEHDMEIFNTPRQADSPDIEAAVEHDAEIFQNIRTGAEDQHDPKLSTRAAEPAKSPSERDRIEALLKGKADAGDLDRFEKQLKAIKFAQITVVSGHTVTANRPSKDAAVQYQVRPATMRELRPLIEKVAAELKTEQQSSVLDSDRNSFRIDDGNATRSRLTIKFDRSPASGEKAIGTLPSTNVTGREPYDFFHGDRTKVEQFLKQNATPEEAAAFQKQLTETGEATLTIITAETITAKRDQIIQGQVEYTIRPATVDEYKPHIERLEKAFLSKQQTAQEQAAYSGQTTAEGSLSSLAQQIHVQREPIDPELDDAYFDTASPAPGQTKGAEPDQHVCGPNCNCAAATGGRKVSVEQALIELAALQGAEHTTDATGNAVLTGADADAILRAVQSQAAAAEAAIQKALRDKQRRAELEDASLDNEQTRGGKEPIALKLTEEQVQLLVSNEYPNEPEKASQSVYKLIRDGEPVNILKESVQLDYSEDIKGFFARLDEAERPALLSKIQDLEKQDEREKRAPEQQRQKARSKDRERG